MQTGDVAIPSPVLDLNDFYMVVDDIESLSKEVEEGQDAQWCDRQWARCFAGVCFRMAAYREGPLEPRNWLNVYARLCNLIERAMSRGATMEVAECAWNFLSRQYVRDAKPSIRVSAAAAMISVRQRAPHLRISDNPDLYLEIERDVMTKKFVPILKYLHDSPFYCDRWD